MDESNFLFVQTKSEMDVIRSVVSKLDVRTRTLPDDSPDGSQVEDHPAAAGQIVEARFPGNGVVPSVTFSDGDGLDLVSIVAADQVENFRDAQHGVVVGNHQPFPVVAHGIVREMAEN